MVFGGEELEPAGCTSLGSSTSFEMNNPVQELTLSLCLHGRSKRKGFVAYNIV